MAFDPTLVVAFDPTFVVAFDPTFVMAFDLTFVVAFEAFVELPVMVFEADMTAYNGSPVVAVVVLNQIVDSLEA